MSRRCEPFAGSLTIVLVACSLLISTAHGQDDPWRLQQAIGDPDWIDITGDLRLRYEGTVGQYRSAARLDDTDHLALQRLRLRFDVDLDPVGLYVEFMDSRHYGGSAGSAINTSISNAVDILQAYASVNLGKQGSGEHVVKVGRYTMDIGSRRLVARNRFRNTINAFTGVQWRWQSEETRVTAFWNMPVRREPNDLASLVDNQIEFDEQDLDAQFFGGAFEWDMDDRHRLEVYAFGLLEDRGRHRDLGTGGARFLRKPKTGEFDFQFEGVFQLGQSRLSGGGQDLDHYAGFVLAQVGYTFDCEWSPRLSFTIEYASGDDNDADGNNNRFETLFGARRGEYGPTSTYGPIARSNMISPELRLQLKPTKGVRWMIGARALWLGSHEDTWTTAGVQDPTGSSGSFVGQQFETRVRWDIVPGNVDLDVGIAYFIGGEFQRKAPGGQDTDTLFLTAQINFKF